MRDMWTDNKRDSSIESRALHSRFSWLQSFNNLSP